MGGGQVDCGLNCESCCNGTENNIFKTGLTAGARGGL